MTSDSSLIDPETAPIQASSTHLRIVSFYESCATFDDRNRPLAQSRGDGNSHADKFIIDSIEQHPTQTTIFIAMNQQRLQIGFASISHAKNFTGEPQAYLGELAVREDAEGHGIGNTLIKACEEWSRNQGYPILVLDTGTANEHARRFYQHLGFQEEKASDWLNNSK